MINYWVFVVNDWIDPTGKKWKGKEIFETLHKEKVWGIGDKTPNRKRLSPGDKVTFYLAGSDGQKFLGTGTLNSNCIKAENLNNYSPPIQVILEDWKNIVTFDEFEAFSTPKELKYLADRLDFIVKKEIAPLYFQSGVRSITEPDFDVIQSDSLIEVSSRGTKEGIENKSEFILEKYLQDFIISNWKNINFDRDLELFQDENGNLGSQYTTDIGYIDILTVDKDGNFIVFELKKGRESDKVVGQLLRYMGWVKKNLATKNQLVEGVIICKESDEKMDYAISATQGISVKHYSIDFKLY